MLDTPSLLRLLAPVVDNIPNGISVADAGRPDLPLVYVNQGFERLTGYSSTEVLGSNCRFLQGPGTRREAVARIRDAIDRRAPCHLTLLNYRRDGTPFWNDLQLLPLRAENGSVSHIIGLQNDVSASREAAELARRNTLYETATRRRLDDEHSRRHVLQQVPFGVLLVDPLQRLTYANPAAQSMLDLADEWRGQPVFEVASIEPLQSLLPLAPSVSEQRLEARVGSLTLGVSIVRADTEAGADPHHILVLRPLHEVEPSRQDVEVLRRLTALGRMAASFAHQVRNPLAAVRSLAEALGEELNADDDRREYTTRILSLVERVEALVRRSLRFTHGGGPSRRMVAPAVLARQSLELLADRWRSAGAEPRVEIPDDLPAMFCDPEQAAEILMIFLENALDAVTQPPRIRLTASGPTQAFGSKAGTFIALDVIDDGPGIDADTRRQLFDPFFTTKARGTGLGLPIAMRLADSNSARIEVDSRPGEGARFRLLLPAMPSDDTP